MMSFWKRKQQQRKPVQIPVWPGHEDTMIEFVDDRGGVVCRMMLVEITQNFNGPATASFADMTHFAERMYRPVCPECGMADGPYPNGDRPESRSPLQSGCPRCGFCL